MSETLALRTALVRLIKAVETAEEESAHGGFGPGYESGRGVECGAELTGAMMQARDAVKDVSGQPEITFAHIKKPYSASEILARYRSNEYSAELLLQHALLLLQPQAGEKNTGHGGRSAKGTEQSGTVEPVGEDEINPSDFHVEVVLKPMGGFAPIATNGVKVTHKPTGISVTVDSDRRAHRNRDLAFEQVMDKVKAARHQAGQGKAAGGGMPEGWRIAITGADEVVVRSPEDGPGSMTIPAGGEGSLPVRLLNELSRALVGDERGHGGARRDGQSVNASENLSC